MTSDNHLISVCLHTYLPTYPPTYLHGAVIKKPIVAQPANKFLTPHTPQRHIPLFTAVCHFSALHGNVSHTEPHPTQHGAPPLQKPAAQCIYRLSAVSANNHAQYPTTLSAKHRQYTVTTDLMKLSHDELTAKLFPYSPQQHPAWFVVM
jgi:hypothetical protein